ncbi:MAG: hypothetical protein IJA72_03470 [Clostridia bacterium]|nr:hypothetical protein [Clostridia bacterium]
MNEKEIKYINADIYDNTQDVFKRSYGKVFWSDVVCTLPKGPYSFECQKTADTKNIYATLRVKGIPVSQKDNMIGFYLDETKTLYLPVTSGGGIETIITTLRRQVLKNKKLYSKKTLIQKAINISSTHNNLGNGLAVNTDESVFRFDVTHQR